MSSANNSRRMSSSGSNTPEGVEQYIIALLGGGGVGKSCITTQFVWRTFSSTYEATIEDTFHTKLEVDGKIANLVVLDTAGQEEYESLRDDWIRHADAIVLVYDVTSAQSVKDLGVFAKSIGRVNYEKYGKVLSQANQGRADVLPITLVGNKRDLVTNPDTHVGYKSIRSDIDKLARNFIGTFPGMKIDEIAQMADLKGIPVLETSAKERMNIDDVFQVAVRQIRKFKKFNEPPSEGNGTNESGSGDKSSGGREPKMSFSELIRTLLPKKKGSDRKSLKPIK